MGFSVDYRDVPAGQLQYSISVADAPDSATDGGLMQVSITGATETGEMAVDGSLQVPVTELASLGRLLNQTLSHAATLHDPTRRAAKPARSHLPWTAELDQELRHRWLDAPCSDVDVAALHRELARDFGRSQNAIRSRLPRVGCNPEQPGAALDPSADPVGGDPEEI
jgi:hypothetical protein